MKKLCTILIVTESPDTFLGTLEESEVVTNELDFSFFAPV